MFTDIIDYGLPPFLALLCATEQQSYCRHAGVRRPSVRPSVDIVFSDTTE